jgi:hypothetical protein
VPADGRIEDVLTGLNGSMTTLKSRCEQLKPNSWKPDTGEIQIRDDLRRLEEYLFGMSRICVGRILGIGRDLMTLEKDIETVDQLLIGTNEVAGIRCLADLIEISPKPRVRVPRNIRTDSRAPPVVLSPGLGYEINRGILNGVGADIDDLGDENQGNMEPLIIPITARMQMSSRPWTRKDEFFRKMEKRELPAGIRRPSFVDLYNQTDGTD